MPRWKKAAKWKRARIAELKERDGPRCWLCDLGIPANPKKQGRRASIEHLQARCHDGGDALENLVLCHDSCNRHLRDRSVEQKLRMREKWHRATRGSASNRARTRNSKSGRTDRPSVDPPQAPA